jgi:hypothetical protein
MFGEVALNIIAQFIFFVANIFILPWLASLVTDKFGDKLPEWIDRPTLIIKSWTVTLLSELLRFPIMFLTFNQPEDLECSVVGGELEIKYNFNSSRYYWYNPIMQIGKYVANAVWILMGPALTILAFRFILPETFAGVVSGLDQWTVLQSGTTNLAYFEQMWSAFRDIIWNRFIMGGLEENVVLLFIFAVILIFFSDYFIVLYSEDEDNHGPGDALFTFPTIALVVILFNAIFALVSPAAYGAVSYSINSVGMILLLVMIIRVLASIVLLCSKAIIGIIWNIFTRR